jgi:hypothetical protein
MRIRRTDADGERRRHNGYGVDLIGGPASLDMAFIALNTFEDLLGAATAAEEVIDAEVQAYLERGMNASAEKWKPALKALRAEIRKAHGRRPV